jgi:hypothetical protein
LVTRSATPSAISSLVLVLMLPRLAPSSLTSAEKGHRRAAEIKQSGDAAGDGDNPSAAAIAPNALMYCRRAASCKIYRITRNYRAASLLSPRWA